MERDNQINQPSLLETRELYEAPAIEVVEVRVERGFQDSEETESEGLEGRPGGIGSW